MDRLKRAHRHKICMGELIKHTSALATLDSAGARLANAAGLPQSQFFTMHLGGKISLNPGFTKRLEWVELSPENSKIMRERREDGTIKLRNYESTEIAVIKTLSEDGKFIVDCKKAGYFAYISGKKGYIDQKFSLLAPCALCISADGKILFQWRSGNVAVGQGLISNGAEGNMVAEDAIAGRLDTRMTIAQEIWEEVGVRVSHDSAKFTAVALDNTLSHNHLVICEVKLADAAGEIERQRTIRGEKENWEVKKMEYISPDDLHEYIGMRSSQLTPSGLFGALLAARQNFEDQWGRWISDTVQQVKKFRQA